MLNKKRLLAMAMSSAMIMGALAGCSNNSSQSDTTTKAPENTTAPVETTASEPEPTTVEEEPKIIEPDYSVEEGKAITFEDGKLDFIKLNMASIDADECTLEIADFNGSKALKVTPTSEKTSKRFYLGLDLNSLLGDKVADVASVQMQIGLEAADGEFHACSGTVLQTHDAESSTATWVTYLDTLNPANIKVELTASYDASKENVLVITKDSDDGSNLDTAYAATGKYSTMYIDNIVFLDKDGNALDVDTTVAFAGPEGYGEADWSNLIQVKDQTVIDGFSATDIGGWSQAPKDWIVGTHEVLVQDVDENGDPLKDEEGNPVYKQKVDEDGNPVTDEEGNPVYETETVGNFDWNSIMKPGLVLTVYFKTEDKDNANPMWFTVYAQDNDGNSLIGWDRIYQNKFATNDSNTMCQITYEELKAELERISGVDEWDFENYWFALQCESAFKWSVSAVAYAYTE